MSSSNESSKKKKKKSKPQKAKVQKEIKEKPSAKDLTQVAPKKRRRIIIHSEEESNDEIDIKKVKLYAKEKDQRDKTSSMETDEDNDIKEEQESDDARPFCPFAGRACSLFLRHLLHLILK